MLLIKNFLGYLNDSWAGTYSQQLARMGSRKTNFLCTLTDKHVLSKEMFWMKTKTVIWFSFHMICETFTRILQPYNIRVAYKPITTLWLPRRLSKRQSLSTTTVLFRTTFTRTIKLNLLLIHVWRILIINYYTHLRESYLMASVICLILHIIQKLNLMIA